ncbi:TonB-dependent siderophore receptor [Gloeobacter morelensis]|uniref:TonB-dependent siderophore receptor n=1 Tax=Gloeobacter morelensis MG652769 TaxID=2781736 RepID=A0ABY3PJK1_9CYAN|nr:TonB-dependent siderophore receptor [Gloeobacter morelensis]UFP93845.1 TonB-dependent siderophore receptor [Gloeobacter morelensis MG652769]
MEGLMQAARCTALALLGGAVALGNCSQVLAERAVPEAGSQSVVRRSDLQGAVHTEAKGLLESALAQAEPTTPAVEPAQAQTIPSPDDAEELDEVTVTGTGGYRRKNATSATKTDTPLLLTPQSIQVIPRQVIEDQGAIRINDALRNVSGVSAAPAIINDNFLIRGFAANQFQNRILDDFGVSIAFRETANLERIEVVKGPASVLFGQAQPSGIINLTTKKPLTRPYYSADLTVGSYSLFRPTLDISGPLNGDASLAYRLNAAYEYAGSFREGVLTGRTFVAPVVQWKIGPDTTLTFEGEHLRDSRPVDFGIIATSSGIPDIPIGRFLGNATALTFLNQNRFYAILEHRFDPAISLRTALRYTNTSERRPGITGIASQVQADNRTVTLSGSRCNGCRYFETYFLQNDLTWKFDTGSVKHTALLGFEFGRIGQYTLFENAAGGTLDLFEPVYPVTFSQPFETNFINVFRVGNFGVYLQDQIAFSESLNLVLSGRFDTYASDSFNLLNQTRTPTYAEAFSPRIGLLYLLTPAVSLFANFSQSFTPVTGVSAAGTPFIPERGTGYEVGAKAELAGGRLFANLALYRITKSNVLTPDPANLLFSIQTGEQQSQGIEFDLTGEILPGWNLIASYAYTDARITRDNTFAVGNRLPNVPLHSGSLWSTYRLQDGPLQGLGFGLGAFAVGERTGNLANSYTVPGYIRTDAALYYSRENFRSTINFKNLFDVRYFGGAESRGVHPGQPFTVQATVGLQY